MKLNGIMSSGRSVRVSIVGTDYSEWSVWIRPVLTGLNGRFGEIHRIAEIPVLREHSLRGQKAAVSRNSVIDPEEHASAAMNGRFSGCDAACLSVQQR